MTELIDYLRSIGFKPVLQTEDKARWKDPTYLHLNRTYAELHDDGKFFLWLDVYTPLYSTNTSEKTLENIISDINAIINNPLQN